MRNLKKVLCLSLALVMLLGMMVVGTSAAFTDADDIVNVDAVNTAVALDIIAGKGDGSYFDPTGIVTRSEMAKMICVALNGGKDPVLEASQVSYTDTTGHWAAGYIEYCSNLGVVAGKGDGTFAPNAGVTGTEAAKMLLVALGYDASIEGFTGAKWDTAVNVRANQKDLYDDVVVNPGAPLSRDNAAQMIVNAIEADMVKYDYQIVSNNGVISTVGVVDDTNESILEKKFGLVNEEGILTNATYNSTTKKYTYTVGETAFTTADDYNSLFRHNVKVLYKAGKTDSVYGIFAEDSEVVLSVVYGSLPTAFATSGADFKVAGVTYKQEATVAYYDFLVETATTAAEVADFAKVDLLDTDDDGKIDTAVAYPYTVEKVTFVNAKTFTTTTAGNVKKEDVIVYDGIAKNDYVAITAAANVANDKATYVKVEVVEGKVTAVKDGQVSLDGTWYKESAENITPAPSLNDTFELVVVNGYYFYIKEITAKSTDLLLVLAQDAVSTFTKTVDAKVLLADGTTPVVTISEIGGNDVTNDNKPVVETLYTYKVVDGKYELTAATAANTGFDGAIVATDGFDTDKDAIGDQYLEDSTVVFNLYGTEKGKVITGAAMKKLADQGADDIVDGFYDETNGFKYAKVVVLDTGDAAAVATDKAYGLVLEAPYATEDDDGVYATFNVWNGTENVLVKEEIANTAALATFITTIKKNVVISYDDKGDGLIDNAAALTAAAVEAYAEGGKNIKLDDTVYTIETETKIFYFDADAVAGAEGGSIQIAGKEIVSKAEVFIDNVYYAIDTGTELDVLFVEINNDLTP